MVYSHQLVPQCSLVQARRLENIVILVHVAYLQLSGEITMLEIW